MNKIVVKKLGKLGIVFLSCVLSITGYVKDSNRVSVTVPEVKEAKVVVKKEAPKEEIQEEVQQEEIVEPIQEEPVEEISIPSEPIIEGNRIQISNILNNNLMKDTDGSNIYLDHNMYGVYDGRGVPYIDFRTSLSGRKTIVYAHSSTSGNGPFQALQNYHNNKGFYDANRYITIYYEGNTYTYEIFSVYVSLADSEESEGLEYFHNIYYNDNDWAETIQKYKNNSEYDTGVSVSGNDQIIILQTCSMDPNYYEQYYRYNLLIMGKLV